MKGLRISDYEKIGLDCDEVTLEFVAPLCYFHNQKYKTQLTREDFKSFNFWEIWGGTAEDAQRKVHEFFYSHNLSKMNPGEDFDYTSKMKPVKDAVRYVSFLKEAGHALPTITSRPIISLDVTSNSLQRYFLNAISEINFSSEFHDNGLTDTKADICKSKGIELMFEDSLENALRLAEKDVKVILFDCPWNQSGIKNENIFRVKGWEEAIQKYY